MFHVPEFARDTTHPELASTAADGNNGAFWVSSPEPGWMLALICSDSGHPDMTADERLLPRWEHVSVHAFRGRGRATQQRTPTWREMCAVKGLCWDPEDVVMQLHPRRSEYVNCHPHVLHLWRPLEAVIPEPPAILVGPK